MIEPVFNFVRDFVQKWGSPKNILEVGSLNVNGSVRNLFHSAYTGIDLSAGDGVEIVMDAMDIKKRFKEGEFDGTICLETLEHTKYPLEIVENMRWALSKGGWMVISTPGIGHPIHDYPGDYYRFFESVYREIFFKDFVNCEFKSLIWDCPGIVVPNDKYWGAHMGYGQKP